MSQDQPAPHEGEPVRPPGSPAASTQQSGCADLQQQLDDALADSFPASDPVSIVTSQAEEYWDGEEAADPRNCTDHGERDLSGVKKPAA